MKVQPDPWSSEWLVLHLLPPERQEERASKFAAIFTRRLRDAAQHGDDFWSIHRRTEPGWWPMKIPVLGWDIDYKRIRYLTPALHDQVSDPDFTPSTGTWPYRREHLITRANLVARWEGLGSSRADDIAADMYAHRWAVVCVTVEEELALRRSAAAVGPNGHQRYIHAGLVAVHDRVEDRLVDIRTVDPGAGTERTGASSSP